MLVSNCCGAEMSGVYEDTEICPHCGEHTSLEEMEKDEFKKEYELEKGR